MTYHWHLGEKVRYHQHLGETSGFACTKMVYPYRVLSVITKLVLDTIAVCATIPALVKILVGVPWNT